MIEAWDRLRYGGAGVVSRQDEAIGKVAGPGGAVRAEDEHFLQCIERDAQPLVTGEIGLRAVEVARATIISSDENRPLTLPLAD